MVVDDDEIIKVHVHTDHPGKAMEEALAYGMLTKLKVDNMRLQFADKVSNAQKAAKAEAQRGNLPYAAPDPDRLFGFVAVAARRRGAPAVPRSRGGSGRFGRADNEPLDRRYPFSGTVGRRANCFVLPNNKNIIMAAEQSVSLADRQVIVLQTKTIPQGLSAMLAFDAEQDADQNFLGDVPRRRACRHRTDYLRCTRQRF